ncbi:MAG: UDPGP type 1 family protein [Thermoguttaceae bacterium]|jgi:UDP-N-acetylglucosamine/UDP-N-acetylgalactosamine diphosphorylase
MKENLLSILVPHGQEHLLAFWDRLNKGQRENLAQQIRRIDFALLDRLYTRRNDQSNVRELANRAAPPPAIRLNSSQNPFTPAQARQRGREALAAGHVGAILVAGGQGTRLGFDHPKGMYSIGPVSRRTLFQVHVEKIASASRRYGVRIPLYLMTSPKTHDETVEFFKRHDRFCLPEEDLFIFCQGTMPTVDAVTGKVLLESPSRIALSPDGHGGMLDALAASGGLNDARLRGIRQLFYFQVDNPLVDICGPEFIGYHILADSELTTQVLAKRDPMDKVGNVVQVDGRLHVIEYSDLPDDVARRRNTDGSLAIWAGSIAVHILDIAMLGRLAESADGLPFHYAHKKVSHINANGRPVEPKTPNAIKFERFIFDLMPFSANAIVVEIDPQDGFGPLKNAPGAASDTPEMVQGMMIAQHTRWLKQAGAEVSEGVPVEISPLLALDVEELSQKIAPGMRIIKPTYFS